MLGSKLGLSLSNDFCFVRAMELMNSGPGLASVTAPEAVCLATKNGAFSLIGGGDSVAALKKFNLVNGVSYISTGGGAMLEYLEGKSLPGIIAIDD